MIKLSNKTLIISSIVVIFLIILLTIIKNDYQVVESNPNMRDMIANRIINDRDLAKKSREHRKELSFIIIDNLFNNKKVEGIN